MASSMPTKFLESSCDYESHVIVHETVRLYNFLINIHHFGPRCYNIWSGSTFTKMITHHFIKFVGKFSQQFGIVLQLSMVYQAFQLYYYQIKSLRS